MSEKLNKITEGSFLRVNEEGKAYWGGQSEGGGVLYVKFSTNDNTNYTADKTFEEIVAADAAGQLVIGQIYNADLKGASLNLTGYLGDTSSGVTGIVFSNAYYFAGGLMAGSLMMTSVILDASNSPTVLHKTMALS